MAGVAAPQAVNWLAAFWVPFGAAALGGVLSAIGAVAAIAWQAREQRTSRDKAAIDLFNHLLREQGRYLGRIGDYRSAQSGQFSFIDADKMQAIFEAFGRNREWLVWIKDESLRGRIVDQISDNHIWVTITRGQASEQQQALADLAKIDAGSIDFQAASDRNQQALTTINNLFADVNRLRDNTLGLAAELSSRA